MKNYVEVFMLAFLVCLVTTNAVSQNAYENAKPNKLYLYFPATDDNTFPEFGIGGLTTSPAHAFNAADLTGFTGTTADLINSIFHVVSQDYSEFNVQVLMTTTAPPTTFTSRNTVAVGTDAAGACGNETWGLAEAVDTRDQTLVDFARVWAGSYNCATGTSGALNGANSTLDRWAISIGGTVAHEAGHNYGLSHNDGLVLAPGEDALVHHLMASGSHFSYDDRAGYRRHFSNNEYSILASNVGLAVKTLWNWDFINPNQEMCYGLRMEFLSLQPSLTIAWSYTGSMSPWINPTVTAPQGTTVFKGITYNVYQITFSTGQNWSNGLAGQVPGGTEFHIGATFSSVNTTDTDPIIITNVDLLDQNGSPLQLHPRVPGFDSGTIDPATGTLNLNFINFAQREFRFRNLTIRQLPRMISLDQMFRTGQMVDLRGMAFKPWRKKGIQVMKRELKIAASPRLKDLKNLQAAELKVPIAKLSQKRHVVKFNAKKVAGLNDRRVEPDVARVNEGYSVDLFPSTAVYISAVVVDPNAKYWDIKSKKYVEGPLSSRLFLQIAGRHPDLNRNGVDDYIDILTKKSRSTRVKGVPDDSK